MADMYPSNKFFCDEASDFREVRSEVSELAESIRLNGLINPITCVLAEDGRFEVIAGRRRFQAMTEFLGWETLTVGVHFMVREGVDKLVIQLEENLRRKDFTPIEVARLIRELHLKKTQEHGKADRGKFSKGWRLDDTAALIGRDKGFVSKMLTIADNESIVKDCTSIAQAMDAVQKEKTKAVLNKVMQARTEKLEASLNFSEIRQFMENFVNDDAIEFLEDLPTESIDFILTDPPYGINLDENSQQQAYDVYSDNPTEILELITRCIPQYYRVLRDGKFIVLWTSFSLYGPLVAEMKKVGFSVATTPLTWVKLNSSGLTLNPNQTLGSSMEIAIYGWKGNGAELSIKGRQNVFPVPIVRGKRIHVAQKPEALSNDLLEIFSHFGDTVLDTFAGSGSCMRSCFLMKRQFIGCEKDPDNYNGAVTYTTDWFSALVSEPGEEGDGNE